MLSWHIFVSAFETSSKSSVLSTSNISLDVPEAKQWNDDAASLYFLIGFVITIFVHFLQICLTIHLSFLSKWDWQPTWPVQCDQSVPCIWYNPRNKFHISHLFLLLPSSNHIECYMFFLEALVFIHVVLQPRTDWRHLGQMILKTQSPWLVF